MSRTRKRRWVWMKWGGVTGCVLLVGLWGVTEIWDIAYRCEYAMGSIVKGSIYLRVAGSDFPTMPNDGWSVGRHSWHRRRWRPRANVADVISSYTIPLWLPLAILTPLTVIAWRKARWPLPGHCECGYNLTGNVSGRCPECGKPT